MRIDGFLDTLSLHDTPMQRKFRKLMAGGPIALEAYSGRWLRCKRRGGGGNRQPTWVITRE